MPRLRPICSVLAPAVFAAAAGIAPAATYYVSNSGSDAAAGSSAAAPFATLAKAASVARSGDTLLLSRGSTFRESVTSFSSGLTFDAYGPAALASPVVSGSTRVTGWQPHSPNVYVANVSGDLGYVFADNRAMTLARFPNAGWLRTSTWTENSDGTNTVLSTDSLKAHARSSVDGYWNGANIRWHRHSWWFETRGVTNYSAAGRLSLAGNSLIAIQPYDKRGWGFYLDNKLEELDAPGEYYHDKAAGKLYFYAPSGANPNDLTVEASARSAGLSVSDATVRNLTFRHQKDFGLQISGTTTVENNQFQGIGSDAGGQALWATWGVRDAAVRGNAFADNLAVAVAWNENPASGGSSVIERNVLTNTGTVDGYGGSGSWRNAGIIVSNGTNVRVRENRIDGTGYAGIIFGSPGNVAERNVIDNAMRTLNDGAAIYTNTSSSTIRDNVIRNTRGGMESSGPWANLAHGIWTEFLGDYKDQVIQNNTVVDSGGWGIYFDNNFDSVVTDNVLVGNDRGQLELSGETSKPPQNHVISGNVLIGTNGGELSLRFRQGLSYGAVTGNHYLNAFTDRVVAAFDVGWSPFAAITLGQWATQYPTVADAAPRTLASALGDLPPAAPEVFLNDTDGPLTLPLDKTYVDLQGRQYVGQVQLDPYDSLVLIPHPLYGDANLDGAVTADDYLRLDRTLAKSLAGAGWANGDFNHDGAVNASDYLLIDRTYALQESGTLSTEFLAAREGQFGPDYVSALLASVPEPTSLGVSLLAVFFGLTARRRP